MRYKESVSPATGCCRGRSRRDAQPGTREARQNHRWIVRACNDCGGYSGCYPNCPGARDMAEPMEWEFDGDCGMWYWSDGTYWIGMCDDGTFAAYSSMWPGNGSPTFATLQAAKEYCQKWEAEHEPV